MDQNKDPCSSAGARRAYRGEGQIEGTRVRHPCACMQRNKDGVRTCADVFPVKAQDSMAMASSHLSPHARWIFPFPRSLLFARACFTVFQLILSLDNASNYIG
ncbi:hypothetical protein SAY86_011289 [Trapa natans]|uniref:Uncharacterized protein n=1 Tax=Trapa natans TaxID=22666 RepID=A0AAN7R509_TRANT|nr:hypothetical protein SAY86_011289 [Trapa natans]